MKPLLLTVFLASAAAVAIGQTAPKPTAPPAKSIAPAARTTTATKLPPGIPPVKGIPKTAFTISLRYQDIKIGTGAVAEPDKLYKVHYTGWRASDGAKFDSSYDHRMPVFDKDHKPVMGADGKPQLAPAEPLPFPQGRGGTITGFDQGFVGMRVGGKRRLFIPWQLGYGTRAIPDRGPDHPGIPAKSDLIFDVELVDMTDMPAQATRPMMPPGHPAPGAMTPRPAAPATPPPATDKPATPPPAAQPAAPATATPPPAADKPATPPPAAQPATPQQPQTKQ